jgi:hypothetical protein
MHRNGLLHNLTFFACPCTLSVVGRESGFGNHGPAPHHRHFTRTRVIKQADTSDLPPPTTRPGPARLSCLDRSRRDQDVEDAIKLANSRGFRSRLKIEVSVLVGVVALLAAFLVGICIYAAARGLINIGTEMAR